MVLGLNTGESGDPAPKARKFRDEHKLTYPVLVDAGDRVAQKYGVTGFPTNVLIDRMGVVRMVGTGYDPGSLDQMITALLKQKG